MFEIFFFLVFKYFLNSTQSAKLIFDCDCTDGEQPSKVPRHAILQHDVNTIDTDVVSDDNTTLSVEPAAITGPTIPDLVKIDKLRELIEYHCRNMISMEDISLKNVYMLLNEYGVCTMKTNYF